MINWLTWCVPPIIGAAIGYITNSIAIKMLFRPLKARYIFNIRVPFTPGVLPKQREKLAENIGAMVERELFTPALLRERLRNTTVYQALHDSMANAIEQFFNTPLCNLMQPGPFSDIIHTLFNEFKGEYFILPTFNVLSELHLREYTLNFLLGIEQTDKILHVIEYTVERYLESHSTLLIEQFRPVIHQAFPALTSLIVRFLKRDEVHKVLEIQGQQFLSHALLKLNDIQRFFLMAGQYDKTLNERMPELIDDLIDQIDTLFHDFYTSQKIIQFLITCLEQLLTVPKMNHACASIIGRLFSFLTEKPIGELIPEGISFETFENLIRTIPTTEFINRFIKKFKEYYAQIPIKELIFCDQELLTTLISNFISDMAQDKIETILKSIDIKTMIRDRINALDMINVERIVLDVMTNQFKWINIFGAILGFIIGIMQPLLSLFFH
ncbi:MAG: DUF445 family protein [Treponema sp.]|jgi:uncharacterized membrane protein YheB (UPF0754 family)|nr:DUF445 family protein [Treponema sp.]